MIAVRLKNVPDDDGQQSYGNQRNVWLPATPRVGERFVFTDGGLEYGVAAVQWDLSALQVDVAGSTGVVVEVYLETA